MAGVSPDWRANGVGVVAAQRRRPITAVERVAEWVESEQVRVRLYMYVCVYVCMRVAE